jgi:hypothetical protein
MMHIKLLFGFCLLCAGCAGDPFQTFYVPGYQFNSISGRLAYSGPPLPPGTVDPPVEYIQIISLEEAKSLGQHFAAARLSQNRNVDFDANWPARTAMTPQRWGESWAPILSFIQ